MALGDLSERGAVLGAMEEYRRLGQPAFLERYGFDESRRYVIEHDGQRYDSKAILAAAHGIQFPDRGPLRPTDFNGGRPTIAKARQLGFEVHDLQSDHVDELGLAVARFMELFGDARSSRFSGAHPASEALRVCAAEIQSVLPSALTDARVRPSTGQGNWAAVPWIAVLHPAVTDTTQRGVYPVFLFHEDMSSVEMTIAQGVTDLKQDLGRREAVREMERTADRIRPLLRRLVSRGFALDNAYSLGISSLGRDYVASTVVHKRFEYDDLVSSEISEDLRAMLDEYSALLTSGALHADRPIAPSTTDTRALMIYVGDSAGTNFETGGARGWWGWREAPEGVEAIRPGDLVAFGRGFSGGSPRVPAPAWIEHGLRELVVGRIVEPPFRTDQAIMPDEIDGRASYPWKFRFEQVGRHDQVPLQPGVALNEAAAEALRMSALTRGAGLLVSIDGSPLLEGYMDSAVVEVQTDPTSLHAAAEAFTAVVDDSGLRLPGDTVVAFLAAVLAKPFAILTGQSGSGKTQIAKRLGEWFGTDPAGRPRYLIVPVRPDWTGPEYLFGYADALRSTGAEEVWAVPDALEFMLRAADAPDDPYLLVLDEMNLAHVERYFADFLSGIESREPVLPELERRNGTWVATGNSQRLPLPRNLFVVGTVNVDETTYLFSPKVLDRAFAFELRTTADELDPQLRRPGTAPPAAREVLDAVVAVSRDDDWHLAHPSPYLSELAQALREAHRILEPSGHDFGHRVFYESLRYAALLDAMGLNDRWDVLDQVVLTKLLPKLHGTRARLEKTLRDLLVFAGDADSEQAARLPRSAAKLQRMLDVLLDAQFVSFTE